MKIRNTRDSSIIQPKSLRLRLRFRTCDSRLSELPDEIICDILSRLPINTAVATSVLSRRWRHLWKGVSRIEYIADGIVKKKTWLQRNINYHTGLYFIVEELTCQKLQLFNLDLSRVLYKAKPKSQLHSSFEFNLVKLVFRGVYNRNVEEFIFTDWVSFLDLPGFLLHSQSLVTLNLYGNFKIRVPENATVSLPNLKHLVLSYLLNLPAWLEPLFRSSPLLESFVLHAHDPDCDFPESLTLIAPSLTSLEINIMADNMILKHTNFFIHAPKLSNLSITDSANFYYFVHDHGRPTTLLNACLDLRKVVHVRDDFSPLVESEGYVRHLSLFVRGMYTVRNLRLQVDASSNIFPSLYSANITDGVCPMFRNITSFTTSWEDTGLNQWTHLLRVLHFFPCLNHLQVVMPDGIIEDKEWDFRPPDSVPNCLVSHIKTIDISVHIRVESDLHSLATYILSHALVLETLHFSVFFIFSPEKSQLQQKQHDLCRLLFNLPKCSTCEVVFSGPSTMASSRTKLPMLDV